MTGRASLDGRLRVDVCAGSIPLLTGLVELLDESDFMVTGRLGVDSAVEGEVPEYEVDVLVIDSGILAGSATANGGKLPSMFGKRVVVLVGESDPEAVAAFVRSGVRAVVRRDGPVSSIRTAILAAYNGDTLISGAILDRVVDFLSAPVDLLSLSHFKELTASERELFYMVAEGRSNAEIARVRSISVRTVKYHVSNIMRKLNLRSRVGIIALAHNSGSMRETVGSTGSNQAQSTGFDACVQR
ncbi:response regulator transcription factor [Saccharothrix violaceirubra]|uniref:DNA-binding NarL/FixJ family response regulator n=1 Tax=Saccharothrix violaceirubra TaxID=413306 RepID=A0A7W7WV27_9PSEU|nr:response regulator transcription factor [Saccharothrix violaceirubra]MBB4964487.1 DNA-binding NarL/FixJ family response regulator [Saccharothrix violaceirubra]